MIRERYARFAGDDDVPFAEAAVERARARAGLAVHGRRKRRIHEARLELGGRTAEFIPTPGHSRGHVAAWIPEAALLAAGDAVMGDGIRTRAGALLIPPMYAPPAAYRDDHRAGAQRCPCACSRPGTSRFSRVTRSRSFLDASRAASDRLGALVAGALDDQPRTLLDLCRRVHAAYGGLPDDRVGRSRADGRRPPRRPAGRGTRRARFRQPPPLPEPRMKITQIRQTIVAIPQHRAYQSSWRRSGHGTTALQSVLVEIDTEEGVTGIGESPVVWAGQADVTRALIAGVEHLVVGADPLECDIIRRRLYAETGMAHLGTQGISWALSGIDTALWDIVGRVAGQPLHRLWGGAWRDRSAFYADLVPGDPEEMALDAEAWVERGFRTLYFKVGFAPDIDEARVRAVRAAVGDGPRIRIDANAAWSPALALRMLQRLGELDIEYVEQPLPAGDPAELARLRARSPVPILAHESSLTLEGTLAVIRAGAADALQLDPRFDAGIAGARTGAQVAEAAGLPVVTHTFGETGVGTALMLQLHAAHRNFVLDNQTYYPNLTGDVILGGPLEFDGPFLAVPTGPGLGVELDRERVAHWASYYEREVAGRRPAGARRPRLPHPAEIGTGLRQHLPAVHDQRLPGDVARLGRGEEAHGPADVLGRSEAAHRDRREHEPLVLLARLPQTRASRRCRASPRSP